VYKDEDLQDVPSLTAAGQRFLEELIAQGSPDDECSLRGSQLVQSEQVCLVSCSISYVMLGHGF
jgi:hypothetical protein